jgi:hypothetical protein
MTTPRNDAICEAIHQLPSGTPITIEVLKPLLPDDFGLEADDLVDASGNSIVGFVADFEHAVVEPPEKPEWLQEKIDASKKPDPFAHVEDRQQMQDICSAAADAVHALQAKLETLRRKTALAREALARAISAYQSGIEPPNLPMQFAKEQSEIRRAQLGTHGETIRRINAQKFVEKRKTGLGSSAMIGPGMHGVAGKPLTRLMHEQVLTLGHALEKSERSAPQKKFGDL